MSKNDRSRSQPTPPTGRLSRNPGKRALLPKALAFAVASCFAADLAIANPYGMSVVNGQVTFNRNGNALTLTNTPGAIINWQGFSIGANEITRFIQQSAASSVLNKVIGVDPSIILGALQSNGRVFLINPSGILFGAGAQIDVAGLVASTLNLSNGDFLAGRLRFTDTPGAGSLVNNGAITTPTGGQVYLIAPNVQNTGIITSPQGQVILAAGRSVELVDAATPNLRVEITAPDTEAVNVGQIIANSGKIGIYSGLIRNSGVIRADGVVQGANGEILLKATNNIKLESGGVLSASGTGNGIGGGSIAVAAGTITNAGQVQANAADNASAGNISMIAQDVLTLEGTSRVLATGADINSSGGAIYLYSYGDATAKTGQLIDMSGGVTSGGAGSGEFSAANFASFSGSVMGKAAPGYQSANFIFDPVDGTIGPATIGLNTTSFAQNNITIAGDISVLSGFTLKLLADHNTDSQGDWHDGVGAIINGGAFTITTANNTNNLILVAAGGGIGTSLAPIKTNMNGGNLSVFTDNPAQALGAAPTFVTNLGSVVNIARLNDVFVVDDAPVSNGNLFRIESGGNITQSGLITVSSLAAKSTNGTVILPLANLVGTVAGASAGGAGAGNFTFNNEQALTIGNVDDVVGIAVTGATGATVNVTTSIDAITVDSEVRATSSAGNATATLTSAAGMVLNDGVIADANANATVTLISATSMTVSGTGEVRATANNADATVTMTAGTFMSVSGPVSANANDNATVTLTANNGSLTVSNTVSADGGEGATISLNSTSGALTLNNSVSADSSSGDANVLVTANGGGALTGTGPISADAGNDANVVLITNGGGAIAMTNTISANGGDDASVSLNSSGAITVNNAVSANASGDDAVIILTAATSIVANGAVSADGVDRASVALTANSGSLTINNAVNAIAGGDALILLTANGGGALTGTGLISADAGNDANVGLITNGGGAIAMTNTISADGGNDASVSLNSSGAITVNNAVSANASGDDAVIILTAATSIVANGAVSADGVDRASVALTANNGSLTINNAVNAFAGGDALILLTANGGGSINMNDTITADAGANAVVTLITNGGGAINLNDVETINAFAGINATVNVTANGGGAINQSSPINADAGNDANIILTTTGGGSINVNSDIEAIASSNNATVSLTTNNGGSIALAANVSADGGEGATISLAAFNGAITRTAGVLSSNGSSNFSEIELNAANGIGTPASPIQLVLGVGPSIVANNTASGNIVLSQAEGSMQADSIFNFAPGGAVDLTAVNGDIIAGFISSQGAITLRSTVAEGLVQINDGAEGAGIVTLIADNMDIQAPVFSGANVINVRTFTAARPILLSSDAVGGALELFQDEIDNLNFGNGVFVGEQVARNNPITFKNPTTIAGVISLFGSSVTQDPLATIAGGLLVGVGPGNVTLTEGANAINRFSTSGAVTGNVTLVTTSNIALGLVQATGAVTVTSGGAITDGNPAGADIIASAVALTAANGIGTLLDPLETQVNSPLSLISTGGDIGVTNVGNVNLILSLTGGGNIGFANTGDVALDSLTFSGVTADVIASGVMSQGSDIVVTAANHLQLVGGSGLTVDRTVSVAGGDLILSGGAGDLNIHSPTLGFTISARDISLGGNNINMTGVDGGEGGPTVVHAARNLGVTASTDLNLTGGAAASGSVTIRNDNGAYQIFTGRDIKLRGGSGNDSFALLFGSPDVDLSVGRTIFLNDGTGGGDVSARIESASANTIRIFFRNRADCSEVPCFVVNDIEDLVSSPNSRTGFFCQRRACRVGVR